MSFMQSLTLRWFMIQVLTTVAVLGEQAAWPEIVRPEVDKAYNFQLESLAWFKQLPEKHEDPWAAFFSSTAAYWEYQSDRINAGKIEEAQKQLDLSVVRSKALYDADRTYADARFLYGVSCCNRARFHVEEANWYRAYSDAREGLSVLRSLVKDEPDYHDAYFAIGVAECFLSDAPALLRPLARLLGFRGSVAEGVKKLERCMERGDWTRVEASYYLAYYHYKLARNGPEAVRAFSALAEAYPRNPIFGYFLGRSFQINHEPLKALDAYQRIRDVCYEVGAVDIGNWASYQIGNILLGEQRGEQALKEYQSITGRLDASTHKQEYFYRLPLKIAETYVLLGDHEGAKAYLAVIQPEWDRETHKMARALQRKLR
jgi:hypothetical protein